MQAIRALILDATVYGAAVGTIAVLFLSERLNASLVFLVFAIVNSVATILVFRLLVPQVEFAFPHVKQTLAEHWRFGKWIVGSEALTFGRANLLKWLIGGFLGIGATGIYAACESLMRAINPFSLGIASVAEPTLAAGYARTGKREVKRIAFKVLLIMVLGTLPICLGVAFASRYLLLVFYGETFAEYGAVVVWLATSGFMFSISYPFANSLQAIDRPDINFRIRIITFVAVISAALFVTPMWGLSGVAAVHCLGTMISLGLRFYFFNRLILRDSERAAAGALGPAR